MAHSAVARAYPGMETVPFVPHTPLLADRWTGLLHFEWSFSEAHPLVIGAGWFGLKESAPPPPRPLNSQRKSKPAAPPPRATPPPEIVAEIVRRGPEGLPVLPGSSLKGAVRQVYEILTPSCALAPGCWVSKHDADPQVCPACSLFGAQGLGGRLAFGEATPVSVQRAIHKVPAAWGKQQGQTGTVRVYDQQLSASAAVEPTWAVWGAFRLRIRVVNAAEEELGLLFASLGWGAASPMLRVGGKKFHGFGGAEVVLRESTQFHPARSSFDAVAALPWASDLAEQALQVPERRTAWDALHAALSATSSGGV